MMYAKFIVCRGMDFLGTFLIQTFSMFITWIISSNLVIHSALKVLVLFL